MEKETVSNDTVIAIILAYADSYDEIYNEYRSRKSIRKLHHNTALRTGLQNRKWNLIHTIDTVFSEGRYSGKLQQLSEYLRITAVLRDTSASAEDRLKLATLIYYNDIIGIDVSEI